MDRRSLTILAIPVVVIVAVLLYFFVLLGTVTVRVNSLDPGTFAAAGKIYPNSRGATVKLAAGSHTVHFAQQDYLPLTAKVSALPFQTKTVSLTPVLTPLGAAKHQVRAAAASFVKIWGTYSYQTFDQHVASASALATPNFINKFLSPAFLPQQKDYAVTSQFQATTTPTSTKLLLYTPAAADVVVVSTLTSTASGATTLQTETETVSMVMVGSTWKADDITDVTIKND